MSLTPDTEGRLLHRPPDPATPTVASDLEGTLATSETWKAIRNYLIANGRKRAVQSFLRRNLPRVLLYRVGLVDRQAFRERWMAGLLALCAGMTEVEFGALGAWVLESAWWPERRANVVDELAAHREAGRRVVVVSGVFAPLLAPLCERLGCEGIGTPIVVQDGKLTGALAASFMTSERKAAQLRPFTGTGSLYAAYGDSLADVPMLTLSEYPTAVAPEPTLRAEAERRGWRIVEG